MSTTRDSTERFSALVEDYDRYRPGYPDAAIDGMLEMLELNPGATIADVGAGTGISSRLLLERGYTVIAVEPNAPMREASQRNLGRFTGFRAVAGDASQTNLPNASVDAVLAAQAFHWFDKPSARMEFQRILRTGGQIALLFNERRVDASPFLQEYEDCLNRHSIDYQQVNHAKLTSVVYDAFFNSYEKGRFPNAQVFDWDGLLGRVRSCSYVPHPGDAGWPALEDELRLLFNEHAANGTVEFLYETQIIIGNGNPL